MSLCGSVIARDGGRRACREQCDDIVRRAVGRRRGGTIGGDGREKESESASSPKIFFEACKCGFCLVRPLRDALDRSPRRRAARSQTGLIKCESIRTRARESLSDSPASRAASKTERAVSLRQASHPSTSLPMSRRAVRRDRDRSRIALFLLFFSNRWRRSADRAEIVLIARA